MKTFEQDLTNDAWTEVLGGGSFVAFDMIAAPTVKILFTETASVPAPSAAGNNVSTWPQSWDMEISGMQAGAQRVWLKGNNSIVGVRG